MTTRMIVGHAAPRSRRRRAASLPFLGALLLSVATAGSASAGSGYPADQENGQHGHYLFNDGSAHGGVICRYAGSSPSWTLTSMVVRPPKVWWPDTDSSNHTQHGRVGWRVVVQRYDYIDNIWTKAYASPTQKATAYEDQDGLYGAGTKAPFTKRTLTNIPSGTPMLRVAVKVIWFRADHTVLGWAKHWDRYYIRRWDQPDEPVHDCSTGLTT